MKKITAYTDGACIGNPGPGGYGVVLLFSSYRKELSAGYRRTTNNRMELMAAIAALEVLKEPCEVRLFSDSQYLVENYNNGAVARWKANGWMRDRKNRALNADLWGRLLDMFVIHQVGLVWVRGHSGNPENERCDRLSNQAARGAELLVDEGYEKGGFKASPGGLV
jgi:ribonuclease HI